MTATRTDVITNALRIMGVANAGFDPASEDIALVGQVYDGLHKRLRIRNKIWWSNSDCVPDEAFGPISGILSGTVVTESSDYGLSPQRKVEVQLAHDKGTRDLTEIRTAGKIPNGERTTANYF